MNIKLATVIISLIVTSMFAHAACDQWDIAYRTTAGSGPIDCGPVSSLTDEPAPASGDLLACALATGELRKCDVGNLPFVSFSTSSELATILIDETGSGAAVFDFSPSLTTPDLGTPSTIVLSNATLLPLSALDDQGTTTTVLHGNAAGTPSFGAVDLANDVTGTLPGAQGGTGQTSLGDVDVADLGCGAAADTYVPQCDGAGGVSWAEPAGSEANNLETITTGIAADEVPVGTSADTVTYTPMPSGGTDGCSGTYDKLVWKASTHSYLCATDAGAGGGMTSWTLAGDTGGGQTITDGNTASIVGDGSGIDTADSATDTLTISYDAAEAESANESVIDLPDLQGTLTAAKGGTGQTSLGAVDAGDLGCGAATVDYALTCDGSGNAGWAAQSGGGDLVDDTTPQLGGDLDVNGHKIISASNGNIEIAPNGTGDFFVNTDDLYVDTSTGNIGIGITSPDTLLTISGTSGSNALSLKDGSTDILNVKLGTDSVTFNVSSDEPSNLESNGTFESHIEGWELKDAVDEDANTYGTVGIGNQFWLDEHLKVGDDLAGASNMSDDANIERYCYNDTSSNCDTYGGLYQWDEAMLYSTTEGAQGICPTNWHIPTDAEQNILDQYLATGTCNANRSGWDCNPAGTALKEGGSSGFNASLAGFRDASSGAFSNLGASVRLWSSSESGGSAWRRNLISGYSTVHRGAYGKLYGFAVRCIADSARDTTVKYAGTASAKVVAHAGSAQTLTQDLNVGNTNSYTIAAYAYTDGSAVTSSEVELYYNGSAVTTTYSSAGGGWYSLTATVTGADAVRNWGVEVKAGETAYIDNFSIQAESANSTTMYILNDGTGKASVDIEGAITARELSSDPADPDEGSHVCWQSDGTETGDDGDIICKITAGGITKTTTLFDFSAL